VEAESLAAVAVDTTVGRPMAEVERDAEVTWNWPSTEASAAGSSYRMPNKKQVDDFVVDCNLIGCKTAAVVFVD